MNHQRIDERSLAFGRVIAARIAVRPELISEARQTVTRWMATCSPRSRPALQGWLAALEGPVQGIIDLLTSDDERSIRLRQSNPFAGVLSQQERNAILLQYKSHDPAAA